MLSRRFVSVLLLAALLAGFSIEPGLKTRLHVLNAQPQAAALRTTDLAGLRLRGIGPATMSGRFDDMDVVESNPYNM
jgi:hypothetical protein